MWTPAVFALCLTSAVLCLDSNEIRSSREIITDPEPVPGAKRTACVRSRDCGEGWCCVQSPSGGRCQRVPQEGEMCILGGPPKSKSRRIFNRCACKAGLSCLRKPGALKGQGECSVHGREAYTPH
ncbi:hypothetical protein AMELA_G00285610 [Ameiurus melas]|uniref:Uncharacterized protein n=1 Tax=Ameiurus melas TaxID=219545 RepID=A0A7J5ZKZ2_AMEME|nr:hypothetical protein AMELA_G00285610 [Ameiurus melas]